MGSLRSQKGDFGMGRLPPLLGRAGPGPAGFLLVPRGWRGELFRSHTALWPCREAGKNEEEKHSLASSVRVSAAVREPSRHAQGLAGSVLSKFKGGCHRGVFTRLLLSLGKISGGTSRCRCSWNAGPHVPRQECRPSCCLLHFGAHRKLRRRSD